LGVIYQEYKANLVRKNGVMIAIKYNNGVLNIENQPKKSDFFKKSDLSQALN